MPKHPRTDFAELLPQPQQCAADLGYRLPAEWEPQDTVWVSLPHNEATWPGCLDAAQGEFAQFIAQLCHNVIVRTTQQFGIATNDSWMRDYGPIFVTRDESHRDGLPHIACHDFIFNGWGEKYPPWDADDRAPQHIARQLHLPVWIHDVVLEGGSIDVDGQGTALLTAQCLLNLNRNPQLSKQDIERICRNAFGVTHCIWLHGGMAGDDTDGHVDTVARFIAPGRVAAVVAPQDHPDYDSLSRNIDVLKAACTAQGDAIDIIELPIIAEPMRYAFPQHEHYDVAAPGLPASYANFLISNGAVFVPQYGQKSDEQACRVLDDAMPEHEIVPVMSKHLIVGLGSLHCLTMQQPKT